MLLISWLAIVFVAAVAVARSFAQRYKTTASHSGRVFRTFRGDAKKLSLSVVIPCYNEETRLPAMLADCVAYIRDAQANSNSAPFRDVELIIVDDCSTDRTVEVAKAYLNEINSSSTSETSILYTVVPVTPNHGKGFAVRSGFFAASGDVVLMADGDNATKFSDVNKLEKVMRDGGVDVVVGSRAHLERDALATRTLGRNILMKVFHFVVSVTYFVATLGKACAIRDTQCGFKLFRRRPCEKLFLNNRLERWAFDVELLILANRCGLQVLETPVNWQEIPGSKVKLSGMAQMGLECLLMVFTYPLGLWEVMRDRRLIS